MADAAILQSASISRIETNRMQMSQEEPPRTTINDMPDEILLEIGKNLRFRKDYCNLCYIKSFQRVARELLYNSCDVDCDLVALLMTVLRFPKLGALIRKLDLSEVAYYNIRTPSPEEIKVITIHVHGLGFKLSELQRWKRNHPKDRHVGYLAQQGIIFALLLLNAPNITSICVDRAPECHPSICESCPDILWQFATQYYWTVAFTPHGCCLTRPPVFQSLRSITIRAGCIEIPLLAPLFKLKSLLELSVWGAAHEHASVYWDPSIFPDDSEITTLRLSWGMIHPKVLALLIKSCKSLESFSYERLKLGSGISINSTKMDFTPVEDALNHYANTLRSLSIYGTAINFDFDERIPFSSLAKFEKLESLKVDAAVLFSSQDSGPKLSQTLPRTLKSLRLLETPGSICANPDGQNSLLSDLIGNMDTILPDLKYLAIGFSVEWLYQEEMNEGIMSDYHTFQYGALRAEMEKRNCRCKVFCQAFVDEEAW